MKDVQKEIPIVLSTNLNFSGLYKKSESIQSKCEDYLADITETSFGSNLLLSFPANEGIRKYQLSNYAFCQLCAKIGVPTRYMKKCLEEGETELVSENINTWIAKFKRNFFIRTYKNRIRGILSDKFSVLDTPDIIDILSDTLQDKYFIKSYYMSEERFHVKALQSLILDIKGEDLFAGLQIDSSDVGRSILTVRFMVYKQVCTNGLIISKGGGVLFEQKHIGISCEDFRKGLKENLDRVPDLVASVTEAIKESKAKIVDKNWIDGILSVASSNLNLTEDAVTKVINLMDEKYSRTRWGLINGMTEIAQNFTLERRIELEKYAGSLLRIA